MPLTDVDKKFFQGMASKGYTQEQATAAWIKAKKDYQAKVAPISSMVRGITDKASAMNALKEASPTVAVVTDQIQGAQQAEAKDKEAEYQAALKYTGNPEDAAAAVAEQSPAQKAVENVKSGVSEVGQGFKDVYGGLTNENPEAGINQTGEGFNKIVGGALGTLGAVPGAALEVIPGGEAVGKALTPSTYTDFAVEHLGEKLGATPEQIQMWKESVGNAANIGGLLVGPKVAKEAGKITGKVLNATGKALKDTTLAIAKPFSKASRNKIAESLINSNIKVDPVRGAENFYKLSKGQTMGQFLLERGIIDNPEGTISKLTDRFDQAKNLYDKTIKSIEGDYKFPVMEDILTEIKDRFEQTRDKNLSTVNELLKKYTSEGLTMSENLAVKRLYERKLKTGYLKDNNSLAVDRATNLDSALRENFNQEAMKSGFENAPEISKEIQLTKAALDSIESKAIRRLVNNQFSLADNMMLIGGAVNPGALALLGVKKILSSPSLVAKMAKALVSGDIMTMKKIPGVPSEIIAIKNKLKRIDAFEEWLKSSGLADLEKGTAPKMLKQGTDIQGPPASDPLETRSQQYRDKTGVFDPSETY